MSMSILLVVKLLLPLAVADCASSVSVPSAVSRKAGGRVQESHAARLQPLSVRIRSRSHPMQCGI